MNITRKIINTVGHDAYTRVHQVIYPLIKSKRTPEVWLDFGITIEPPHFTIYRKPVVSVITAHDTKPYQKGMEQYMFKANTLSEIEEFINNNL